MNKLFEVGIILKAIDNATKPIKKLTDQLNQLKKAESLVALSSSTKAFSNNLAVAKQEAGALGLKLAALGGAGGWLFKTQFVDTAAQFETFGTILGTVEGSAEKADNSLKWVSDFAAKTPYELGQVMEGFVKLRAYGLEPTNGLLKTLGDTSSAMGKPLMQAVEAIADAVTGENERLKEFGIKARTVGNKIVYEYSHNGKTLTKSADKSNRQMIESTLTAIFNTKYKDAMLQQSKTWTGMMSNIADQWTRFKIMVMQAGVFDFLKNKLQGVLDQANKLADSGKLAEMAKSASIEIIKILKDLWEITKAVITGIRIFANVIRFSANVLGGYHNLIKLIVLFMSAKFMFAVIKTGKSFLDMSINVYKAVIALKNSYIAQNMLNAIEYRGGFLKALQYWLLVSKYRTLEAIAATKAFAIAQYTNLKAGVVTAIASLRTMAMTYLSSLIPAITGATATVWGFTTALLANPITWVVGLIAILAGSAYLIIKNWEPIKKFFAGLWKAIISIWQKAVAQIKSYISTLQTAFKPLLNIFEKFNIFGKTSQVNTKIEHLQKLPQAGNLPKVQKFNANSVHKNTATNNTISYSPTISINGASANSKNDFAKMLQQHSSEIERIVQNSNDRKMRLAY